MIEETKAPQDTANISTEEQSTTSTLVEELPSPSALLEQGLAPELAPSIEDGLLERIAALEAEVKEEHSRLLRTAADLDNLRKRSRRDVDDALARGRIEVLRDILPVMDSVDLALASTSTASTTEAIIDGLEMMRRQFLTAMERFGLKPVTATAVPFDPMVHEAVSYIPSPHFGPGEIIQQVRAGYTLGDRLLRPTLVVVSQGQQNEAENPVVDKTAVDETQETAETAAAPVDIGSTPTAES